MEWIDRDILEPSNGQKVMIRVFSERKNEIVEIEAVYLEDHLTKRWFLKGEDADGIIQKPTHWMPLPRPPK